MGLAAATAFAGEGARVAVIGRDRARLEAAEETLRARGAPDVLGLSVELTQADEVQSAFAAVAERWDQLNVLVNAAGPAGVGRFESIDDAEWLATFDMGVLAAGRCIRYALPMLRRASWGRIVNISAHSTHRQSPELPAYTASKAALTSLGKNLAQSLAPEGILVNTVSPGTFLSQGLRDYMRRLPAIRGVDPDSLYDTMRVIAEDFGHPAYMGRAGDPAEIGAVIAFIGSRINTYMTGADINVDGGSDF
jgi:NAD(P)-dependent dehydrogenase (short-subunit alcohol dehydrogenase family)